MVERRAMGALEAEVLGHLWERGEPATPGEVQAAVGQDLAYTTVMTILTRLWQKGLVERHRDGRAYAYAPKLSEAEYAAQRMQAVLGAASDRQAVLSTFTEGLPKRDVALLRQLLDGSK